MRKVDIVRDIEKINGLKELLYAGFANNLETLEEMHNIM